LTSIITKVLIILQADTAYLRNHSTDKKLTTMEVTDCKKAVRVLWAIILLYKLPVDQAFLTNPSRFKHSCYCVRLVLVMIIYLANIRDLLDVSDHARSELFSPLSLMFLFGVKICRFIRSFSILNFRHEP